MAPDTAYDVLDRQLEGVAGVGIKDIQLVGDSKWQDL